MFFIDGGFVLSRGTGDRESENKARKYRLFRLGCIFFAAIGLNKL